LEIRTPGVPHSLADRDGDVASPPGLASEIGESSALPVGAKTFRRQRFGLIIGSVVLATLAFSGYWAYRQRSIVDSSSPAATPAAAIDRNMAAADDAKEGKADKRAEFPGIATSSSQVPPNAAARATANNEGVDQGVVKPPEAASAVAAAVKRQKTTNAAVRTERQPTERQPPNLGPCTEAIAALGLCTPEPTRPEE
jgi:FtsZ-interacting cell division protein ZipA